MIRSATHLMGWYGSGGKSSCLAVGGLTVQSHPGCVEVSLSKTPNPQLLLTSWLVPCMAANCHWCVNVCVDVCVNGWMRGINCTALSIKALHKCSPFTVYLLQAALTPIAPVTPGALLHAGILPAESLPQRGEPNMLSRPNSIEPWPSVCNCNKVVPAPKPVALAVTPPRHNVFVFVIHFYFWEAQGL